MEQITLNNPIIQDQIDRINNKISSMRTKKINKIIEKSVPKWLFWLFNRFKWLPSKLGYKFHILPLEKSTELVREELVLTKKDKVLSRHRFIVSDKRI